MRLAPPPPPLRLSSRPLLGLAVAFGTGIVLAQTAPALSATMWLGSVGLVVLAAGVYTHRVRRRLVSLRGVALIGAALVGTAGLGAARLADWRTLRPSHIAHVARDAWVADSARDDRAPITLWATVREPPTRSTWSIRFVAAVDSAARNERGGDVTGLVQVSLLIPDEVAPVYPVLRLGDRVRLTGRLEPPPVRRNPSQMDYGAYLRHQGIHASLRAEDETGVAFLHPTSSLSLRLGTALQHRIHKALARHVADPDARAVLLALLLADRSRIEAGALDTFRQTGLMHLLAVSGLHVGLVGLALYVVLKPLLTRLGLSRRTVEWSRAAVTIGVLALYVLVTGGSVSVERAFVMAVLLVVGRAWERPADTLNSLGAAALVLLTIRPAALFEVGFQLSFGAVAALVTLVPLLMSAVPDRVRDSTVGSFVSGSLVASLAATLGTAPALLAHFGALPLGGLLLNLPAIPLTGITLAGGLGTAVFDGWLPLAATGFSQFAEYGARGLLWTSRIGASGLGWATYTGYLNRPSLLVAVVLFLLVLALWRRPVACRRFALAGVGMLCLGVWIRVATGAARPTLDVVFLDVGQGDATLLSFPNGRRVLVDAGLRSPYVDEGLRTIVPHLKRYGIDRLDALVLTHPDADHIGGARAVLENVDVGRVLHNGQAAASDLWADVQRAADSLGVSVEAITIGDTIGVDPAARLRVLGPSPPLVAGSEPNDASAVLLAEYGRTRWLLTGDAEASGEAALVARYHGHLSADVVKVGHHGSRTSSTPRLVSEVGHPAFAIVSVARHNRYGLPNAEPLARWRQTGAQTLLTSAEGAVWLRSDGDTVERVAWR